MPSKRGRTGAGARLSLASPRTSRRICTLCQWPTASERPLLGRPFPWYLGNWEALRPRVRKLLCLWRPAHLQRLRISPAGANGVASHAAAATRTRTRTRTLALPSPAYAIRATVSAASPPTPDVEHFKIDEYVAQVAYIAEQRSAWDRHSDSEQSPTWRLFGGFSVDQTVDITVRSARAIHEASPGTRVIEPGQLTGPRTRLSLHKGCLLAAASRSSRRRCSYAHLPRSKEETAFKHVKKSVAIGESTRRRVCGYRDCDRNLLAGARAV